jgi:hypothetical protein
MDNAVAHEFGQRIIAHMLQRTAPASAEMAANRRGVIRPAFNRTIRAQDIPGAPPAT